MLHLTLHFLHLAVQLCALFLSENGIHFRLHQCGKRGNFTGYITQLFGVVADSGFVVVRLDFTLQLLLQVLGTLAQLADLALHVINNAADFALLVVRQPHHFCKLGNLVRLAGLLGECGGRQAQGNQCGTDKFHNLLHNFLHRRRPLSKPPFIGLTFETPHPKTITHRISSRYPVFLYTAHRKTVASPDITGLPINVKV